MKVYAKKQFGFGLFCLIITVFCIASLFKQGEVQWSVIIFAIYFGISGVINTLKSFKPKKEHA